MADDGSVRRVGAHEFRPTLTEANVGGDPALQARADAPRSADEVQDALFDGNGTRGVKLSVEQLRTLADSGRDSRLPFSLGGFDDWADSHTATHLNIPHIPPIDDLPGGMEHARFTLMDAIRNPRLVDEIRQLEVFAAELNLLPEQMSDAERRNLEDNIESNAFFVELKKMMSARKAEGNREGEALIQQAMNFHLERANIRDRTRTQRLGRWLYSTAVFVGEELGRGMAEGVDEALGVTDEDRAAMVPTARVAPRTEVVENRPRAYEGERRNVDSSTGKLLIRRSEGDAKADASSASKRAELEKKLRVRTGATRRLAALDSHHQASYENIQRVNAEQAIDAALRAEINGTLATEPTLDGLSGDEIARLTTEVRNRAELADQQREVIDALHKEREGPGMVADARLKAAKGKKAEILGAIFSLEGNMPADTNDPPVLQDMRTFLDSCGQADANAWKKEFANAIDQLKKNYPGFLAISDLVKHQQDHIDSGHVLSVKEKAEFEAALDELERVSKERKLLTDTAFSLLVQAQHMAEMIGRVDFAYLFRLANSYSKNITAALDAARQVTKLRVIVTMEADAVWTKPNQVEAPKLTSEKVGPALRAGLASFLADEGNKELIERWLNSSVLNVADASVRSRVLKWLLGGLNIPTDQILAKFKEMTHTVSTDEQIALEQDICRRLTEHFDGEQIHGVHLSSAFISLLLKAKMEEKNGDTVLIGAVKKAFLKNYTEGWGATLKYAGSRATRLFADLGKAVLNWTLVPLASFVVSRATGEGFHFKPFAYGKEATDDLARTGTAALLIEQTAAIVQSMAIRKTGLEFQAQRKEQHERLGPLVVRAYSEFTGERGAPEEAATQTLRSVQAAMVKLCASDTILREYIQAHGPSSATTLDFIQRHLSNSPAAAATLAFHFTDHFNLSVGLGMTAAIKDAIINPENSITGNETVDALIRTMFSDEGTPLVEAAAQIAGFAHADSMDDTSMVDRFVARDPRAADAAIAATQQALEVVVAEIKKNDFKLVGKLDHVSDTVLSADTKKEYTLMMRKIRVAEGNANRLLSLYTSKSRELENMGYTPTTQAKDMETVCEFMPKQKALYRQVLQLEELLSRSEAELKALYREGSRARTIAETLRKVGSTGVNQTGRTQKEIDEETDERLFVTRLSSKLQSTLDSRVLSGLADTVRRYKNLAERAKLEVEARAIMKRRRSLKRQRRALELRVKDLQETVDRSLNLPDFRRKYNALIAKTEPTIGISEKLDETSSIADRISWREIKLLELRRSKDTEHPSVRNDINRLEEEINELRLALPFSADFLRFPDRYPVPLAGGINASNDQDMKTSMVKFLREQLREAQERLEQVKAREEVRQEALQLVRVRYHKTDIDTVKNLPKEGIGEWAASSLAQAVGRSVEDNFMAPGDGVDSEFTQSCLAYAHNLFGNPCHLGRMSAADLDEEIRLSAQGTSLREAFVALGHLMSNAETFEATATKLLENWLTIPTWISDHPEFAAEFSSNVSLAKNILQDQDSMNQILKAKSCSETLTALAGEREVGDILEEDSIEPAVIALLHLGKWMPIAAETYKSVKEGSIAGAVVRPVPFLGDILGLGADVSAGILTGIAKKEAARRLPEDAHLSWEVVSGILNGTPTASIGAVAEKLFWKNTLLVGLWGVFRDAGRSAWKHDGVLKVTGAFLGHSFYNLLLRPAVRAWYFLPTFFKHASSREITVRSIAQYLIPGGTLGLGIYAAIMGFPVSMPIAIGLIIGGYFLHEIAQGTLNTAVYRRTHKIIHKEAIYKQLRAKIPSEEDLIKSLHKTATRMRSNRQLFISDSGSIHSGGRAVGVASTVGSVSSRGSGSSRGMGGPGARGRDGSA